MLAVTAAFFFPLLLAFAASSDLLTMRISNRIVLAIVVGFFIAAQLVGLPPDQVGMHLLAAGVVLVAGFSFFAFGWIGGGDAKLAAATALWLGFSVTLPYLVLAALLGGVLTIAILLVRRWPLPRALADVPWIDRLHDAKSGVPYGVALAAAGIIVYSDSAIFQIALG